MEEQQERQRLQLQLQLQKLQQHQEEHGVVEEDAAGLHRGGAKDISSPLCQRPQHFGPGSKFDRPVGCCAQFPPERRQPSWLHRADIVLADKAYQALAPSTECVSDDEVPELVSDSDAE